MASHQPRTQQRLPKRRLSLTLTPAFLPLTGIARNAGVAVLGTRGVGKSTSLFLFTLLDALYYRKSVIVITPIPQVIDLFFSLVCTFRPEDQAQIWPHVRYINLSGYEVVPDSDPLDWHVMPASLYYQSGVGIDSSSVVASRLPAIFLVLDENLKDAPVQGYRALEVAAISAGRILATLNMGVTHLVDLIRYPESDYWQQRMRQALALDPTLREAANYFNETLIPLSPGRRFEQTNALLSRLNLFADPVQAAIFGGTSWAVPWKQVFSSRFPLIAFYDLSQEPSPAVLRFKMTFLFLSLVDYIRRWGARRGGDRSHGVSVIVDEIAALVGEKDSPIADELDRFVNTYSRNFNIEFVTSMQEPYQLRNSPKTLDTLMSLGTKFYGRMTSPSSSRLIADMAIPWEPLLVKEMQYRRVGGIRGYDVEHPVYYTKQEQIERGRQRFDNLPVREFLLQRTAKEGGKPLPLERFSLNRFHIDPPDPTVVAEVKRQLTLRDGIRVRDALAQITREREGEPAQSPPRSPDPVAPRSAAPPIFQREALP